jgi:outer membrane protein TolC
MFSLLYLVFATNTWAGSLTLQECLQKAKTNNPVLVRESWETKIAQDNVQQASSALYPRIDAQAGYTMQLEPQAVIISGRTAETQEADYAYAGLSATYTLYDFGKRSARKQQAETAVSASSQNYEALRSDISLQVIESYFGILESEKLIKAAADEVTQVEQHRHVAQVLFEEGVVTRNDVLQADVRLAAARQKLLSTRNRRENIWLKLNFLTGSKPVFRSELEEISLLENGSTDINEKASISNRHDIQALRHRVSVSESEVSESRSSFYPELFTRLGLDYVQNDKVREQTIMSATVGVKFNIFDGFASTSARERAIKNRSKIEDSLRLAEQQAQLEIDTARNDVRIAKERIGVAESAIRQSEENLRINQERYQERVGTATEVLDAQTLVTQAKADYYRAFYDHQTATARLNKSLGEL